MASTGALRRLTIGFVAVLGAAMLLGGCSAQKKREDAMKAETQEWREKYSALEATNREKDTRISELETRLSAAETKAQTQVPPADPYGRTAGVGDSSNDQFQRDQQGDMRAKLSGDVLFASGQATLRPEAKKTLDTIANEIKRKYSGHNVRVEGHTDTDPIRKSKFPSNQALSLARAQAVEQYLVSRGIGGGRIDPVGYGSSQPKGTKAASRRVEIVILN